MKFRNIIYRKSFNALFLLLVLTSCISQSEYDKVTVENESLKKELDECKNGAEKIIVKVEKAYSEKNFKQAKEMIAVLYEKYPESPKNKEFVVLLDNIKKEELAEKERKEAEEKERIRLENLNNTGIWIVTFYVDDFGEPTKNGYIKNEKYISGKFSNTATEDSELNVRFLISNPDDICIMLFEYAGNNPVKAYSPDIYKVLIKDSDGDKIELQAVNSSDRLCFNKSSSNKIHKILMKGGGVKFKIIESDTPSTQYEFTIEKADRYENAYKKLVEA
tara:strand:- start:115 stop:942 length:828 start_codon:yes stop_codon:yes gene_type:complete